MGIVLLFAARSHVRTSATARRSAGTCIRTSDSYVTPGIPASDAPAIIKSQYTTGIEPVRFCSPAVEGPLPITRAYAAGPPKAAIKAGTVSGAARGESMNSVYRIPVNSVNRTSVDKPCLFPDMGESSDRLKQARETAGFTSARSAAIRHRWTPSTYASHENGQIPEVPREAAIIYGKAFKVSPSWILTGEGPMDAQNIVRVMGRIGAGGEIGPDMEQVPVDGLDEIELPMPVGPDAIAFEVVGMSMFPRFDPGMLVVCSSAQKDPDALIGREVAVRTSDGRRYLKKLRQGSKRGLYTLESFNADPIQNVRLAWIGEVLFIVPANRKTKVATTAKRAAG